MNAALDKPEEAYPQSQMQQYYNGSGGQAVRMKRVFTDVRQVGPKSQALARYVNQSSQSNICVSIIYI